MTTVRSPLVLPFRRTLEYTDLGPDVRAVKRALARAGFGPRRLLAVTPVFGPFTVRNLQRFQTFEGLAVDGVYGPLTHEKLLPWFDSYASKLYVKGMAGTVQLPAQFFPTHETLGLAGYPAVDVFAPAGTLALSPVDGVVSRVSGKAPTPAVKPGGPYGWSLYLGPFFLTHFGSIAVFAGDQVRKGQPLGTIADYAKAPRGVTPSHIHLGRRAA